LDCDIRNLEALLMRILIDSVYTYSALHIVQQIISHNLGGTAVVAVHNLVEKEVLMAGIAGTVFAAAGSVAQQKHNYSSLAEVEEEMGTAMRTVADSAAADTRKLAAKVVGVEVDMEIAVVHTRATFGDYVAVRIVAIL
jgi:hypothetical protein